MKKIIATIIISAIGISAFAGAKVTLRGIDAKRFEVFSAPIEDFFKARSFDDPLLTHTEAIVEDSVFTVEFPEGPARRYLLKTNVDSRNYIDFYAESSDNLELMVTSVNGNFQTVAKGNDFVDDMERMHSEARPLRAKLDSLQRNDENYEKLYGEWLNSFEQFAIDNPNSKASIVALNYIQDPQKVLEVADKFTDDVKNSYLAPVLNQTLNKVNKAIIRMKNKENIAEGKIAPDFTLPNEKGKLVKLSQFKGKWVILDFWGTWCPWCIKGIPQMKENYVKYKKKMNIISVACREESKEAWLEGLKEYKLPWVQLYSDGENTPSNDLVEVLYAVEGYPTKLLIDPKGKIHTICVGEDPRFYDTVKSAIESSKK